MPITLTAEQKAALQAELDKRNKKPAVPTVNQITSSLQGGQAMPAAPPANYTPPPSVEYKAPNSTLPVSKPEDRLSLEEYVAYQKAQGNLGRDKNPSKPTESLKDLVNKVNAQAPSAEQQAPQQPLMQSQEPLMSQESLSSQPEAQVSEALPTFKVPQQTLALEQGQNPFPQSSNNDYSPQYPTKQVLMSRESDLVSRGPAEHNQSVSMPTHQPSVDNASANQIAQGTQDALKQKPSTNSSADTSDRFRFSAYYDPRPETVAHQEAYQDKLIDLQKKQNDILSQGGVEIAALNQEKQEAEHLALIAAKEQKAKDDQAIQGAVMDRMEAIDKYNASTIDPDRAWKERGDMARITAALAIGFGAFANAYSGGKVRNTPLDIINQMIDRDIRSQEQDIEKKGKSIDIANNSLAMHRQLAGDNRAAELAERGRLLDVYKTRVANLLAKYDDATFQLEGVKTIEKMQAEKTQIADNLRLALYQERQRALAAANAAANAREKENWERGFKVSGLNKDVTVAEINNAGKAAERTVRIPSPTNNIQQYNVDSPDAAKLVKQYATDTLNLTNSYNAILKMLKDNDGNDWKPTTTAAMKQHVSNIDGILRSERYLNTGANMSPQEFEMLRAFRPDDANSIDWLRRNKAILEGGKKIVEDRYRNTMRIYVPDWDTAASVPTQPLPPEPKK